MMSRSDFVALVGDVWIKDDGKSLPRVDAVLAHDDEQRCCIEAQWARIAKLEGSRRIDLVKSALMDFLIWHLIVFVLIMIVSLLGIVAAHFAELCMGR